MRSLAADWHGELINDDLLDGSAELPLFQSQRAFNLKDPSHSRAQIKKNEERLRGNIVQHPLNNGSPQGKGEPPVRR